MKVIIKAKEEKTFFLENVLNGINDWQMLFVRKRGCVEEYIIAPTTMDSSACGSYDGSTIISNNGLPYTCEVDLISKAILKINFLYKDEFRVINANDITVTVEEK